ncbi:MAG: hypothetical protein JST93_11430 [Acidobacteria bacterium]|nr:hypothetical protein [Acidobacteriota bacterium]
MNGPNQDPRNERPQHLLGGHAMGNLPEQEREELFAAALQDQQLFDALMDEEALREMLEQPGAKRELIDALRPKESLLGRFRKWMGTPMGWGAAGAVATTALVVGFFATRLTQPVAQMQMAKQNESAPVAITPPPAAAAPEARKAVRARQPEVESKRPATVERDKREEAPAEKEMARNQAIQQQAPRQIQAIREQQQAAPVFDQQVQVQRQDSQQPVGGVIGGIIAPPAVTAAAEAPAAPPPAPKAAPMRIAAPPVQYTLLKRDEQGNYAPATTFRDSDAVRIRVTASQDGFVALTRRGEAKAIVSLTPVREGQTLLLPASGFLLPSSQPYRLEFARQIPMAPGATGVIGGFRAGSPAREMKDELAKSKDAAAPAQPTIIEILIKGTEN